MYIIVDFCTTKIANKAIYLLFTLHYIITIFLVSIIVQYLYIFICFISLYLCANIYNFSQVVTLCIFVRLCSAKVQKFCTLFFALTFWSIQAPTTTPDNNRKKIRYFCIVVYCWQLVKL